MDKKHSRAPKQIGDFGEGLVTYTLNRQRFALDPVVAHAVCIPDDRVIHLFMLRVSGIRAELKPVKHGYRFLFGPNHLKETIALKYVDYSCWSNEQIGDGTFAGQSH